MSENNRPQGRYFSRVYLERGPALSDSPRGRTRIYGYFAHLTEQPGSLRTAIAQSIRMELGVQVPIATYIGYDFDAFFKKADMRDVLDAITITHEALQATSQRHKAEEWRTDVARVFAEEGLLYTVDAKCGVHRAIDAEFDHNRASAIRALAGPRYAAVLQATGSAFGKFEQPRQDLKGAIRDIFEAAETLFKVATASSNVNLTATSIRKHLQPLVNKVYATADPPTISTAGRMLSSFESWVDAAHPFRHGHQTETPVSVPEELGVLLLSQGASFLRWLADIDRMSH